MGPPGPPGEPFAVDASGLKAERPAFVAGEPPRSYLADDTGELSVKRETEWGPWIQFRGRDGEPGPTGASGIDGTDGNPGERGPAGDPGADAFETWRINTSQPDATFEDYRADIEGAPGQDGLRGEPGLPGQDGESGLDALDVYRREEGLPDATYEEYRSALEGEPGSPGPEGASAKPDAAGPVASRADWDAQARGFLFHSTDENPAGSSLGFRGLYYYKASDTLADWTAGVEPPAGVPGVDGLDSFETWKVIQNLPDATFDEYREFFKGYRGATGLPGPGVPIGGDTGHYLRKKSAADRDTEFVAPPWPTASDLANSSDAAKGASLVGFDGGTVRAELSRYKNRVFDVSRYNTPQAAADAWMLAGRGTLYFPPGVHAVTDTLLFEPTKHLAEAMEVRGDGATIFYGAALAGKPVVHLRNNTDWLWRGLTWAGGITIRGDGTNTGASAESAQLLLEADDAPGALHNFRLVKPRLEAGMGHGLHLKGYVFQGLIDGPEVMSGANAAGRGVYVEYAHGRNPSQLRLVEPITQGFLRGIENTNTSDLVILGGTFLAAREYGGYLRLSGGLLLGTHFEDNWRSAADITSGNAGLYAENRPNLVGVTSPTTIPGQKQRWGIRTYVSPGNSATVQGGLATVNAGGGAGSTLAVTGVPEPDITRGANVAVRNLDTAGRVSADRGDRSVFLTAASEETQIFATALAAARTVALPAAGYNGARFRVVRSGLGPGTLDVGGLKTIPADTAACVEVAHDGSSWRLVGYGAL